MKSIYQFFSVMTILLMWGCQSSPTPTTTNTDSPEASSAIAQRESFNEEIYLLANPDVVELIKQGNYKSGLDHYNQVGQTATKPDGEHYGSFFTGTNGNDTVRGIGQGEHAHFVGIDFEIVPDQKDPFPLRPQSLGKGEIDTIVGTTGGVNEFILGSFITSVNPTAEAFYVGEGDKDYAKIQNFTKSKDMILLAGKPDEYKWESMEGNVRISTSSGDLVAIVEGIDKLERGEIYEEMGVFILK